MLGSTVGVPLITPVLALIVSAEGRLVALHVTLVIFIAIYFFSLFLISHSRPVLRRGSFLRLL